MIRPPEMRAPLKMVFDGAWHYFEHADMGEYLLQRGMNANHMHWNHVTLLHDMAYTGDIPTLSFAPAHDHRHIASS